MIDYTNIKNPPYETSHREDFLLDQFQNQQTDKSDLQS